MNPDYPAGAFFKHQTPHSLLTKAQAKRDAEAALHAAYDAVDRRDQRKCRATGQPLVAGAVEPRMRLERHHLKKRSTNKSLVADAKNIVTVSAAAHRLIEAHALLIEGDDADKRLIFHWNHKVVKRGHEPFKLLSKRRSQNPD